MVRLVCFDGGGVVGWGGREIMQRKRRGGLEVQEVMIQSRHSESRSSRIFETVNVETWEWRLRWWLL